MQAGCLRTAIVLGMENPDPPERYTRAAYWRLRPSTFDAVELLAHQDGRTVNRMADRLICEALGARRAAAERAALNRTRSKKSQRGSGNGIS